MLSAMSHPRRGGAWPSVRMARLQVEELFLDRCPGEQGVAGFSLIGYRQWVPLWIEDQPHSQDSIVAMLVTNAGWRASVWFGNGTAMIGKPVPTTSLSSPSARVSEMPAVSLLIVLKVAGATTNASGGGRTSGSSGRL